MIDRDEDMETIRVVCFNAETFRAYEQAMEDFMD
jgi:hypothetical protein